MPSAGRSRFHEITEERRQEFVAKGLKPSLFFPHRFYCLPKGGPDGLILASTVSPRVKPSEQWEIVLYGAESTREGIPDDLFFDDEILWHRQQFGMAGQVAAANLVQRDNSLYALVYQSDLVQRISRRREYKTRVEKRFEGWVHMLLNAVMSFGLERGCDTLYSITADQALANTDRSRHPQPELYRRIYDRTPAKRFSPAREGRWWRLDLRRHRDRLVLPQTRFREIPHRKVIALCHDVERALGHDGLAPEVFARMERESRQALAGMLEAERELDVRATYHVLGLLFGEIRAPIEAAGHASAFHSYDHAVERTRRRPPWTGIREWLSPPSPFDPQLYRCRTVDYRLKGYRPPQSRIGSGLSDRNLAYYNFEWLASSASSLGFDAPRVENGLVKIPIHFDDFPLYRGTMTYPEWEKRALETIDRRNFVVFSLHDCYGGHWLPHYRKLLEKVRSWGEMKTLDEISSEALLSRAH